MVFRTAFSLGADGWNPYSATLEQYRADSTLQYGDSILNGYYRAFRPTTVQELIAGPGDAELDPIHKWPPVGILYANLWSHTQRSVERTLAKVASRAMTSDLFVGPMTNEQGNHELVRLTRIYDSIRRQGYKEALADHPIQGYFLEDEGDTRFVVLSGIHRIAALHSLRYEHAPVELRSRQPAVLPRNQLYRWTKQRGGIYSEAAANALFKGLWRGRGTREAKAMNLL